MGEVAAAISMAPSGQQQLLIGIYSRGKLKKNGVYYCEPKSKRQFIRNQMATKGQGATYSSRISTDIPLYESPGASFDRYLEDKPRVFRAMFPDHRRSKQVTQTRWQLEGLDNVVEPSQFSLGVNGALYADRLVGASTRLKGQLEMNISFILPPVLALIPEDVRKNVAETVLTGLVENMKHKVNGSLLADYSHFKRERLNKNLA